MTKATNLPTSQKLIKHLLLWTVFGYCYQSAISLLVKMAIDAQPEYPLITGLIYGVGFNVLAAHLITKYDKHWPVIGSVFIGCIGLLVVPFLLFGESGLLTMPLLVGILFSLPLCSYIVGLIKLKLSKN
ncbi:hypothetical protein I6F50_02515 [Pseudoalteromonas sp. NZS127_1]|jgi:hypothetical protein|uniref:Uncharacterized protein n=1 Tax=Pseudoalteromonas arctica TaxID=394751 RepID=A0AAP7CJG4_9GAMM|nr:MULTISPECIES: hypothetical protein [Pseudoalteromonas]MBA6409090.1 hypothetical protein [Pseudoalteromonas sp. 5Ae-yellow]MBG9993924.1 hypothetical protein [Pseudoalteromonas sp. NZS127_1]MBH0010845.1 hypothetical protein [Pseudoalteromonas sp. NZS100_1]MBH0036478.1 hypothetical protein [Pseudoalteromonas sp. NZS71_1]MBH0050762.1 hypothetical protein [Pseudoalteromonas sp. SWYJZ19]